MKAMFGSALLLSLFASTPALAADDAKTKPAIEIARKWVELIDAGDAGRSYDEAASLFRGALTREAWISTVTGVRKPLGKVVKRELKSATFAKTLPGAPDGEYVVVQFTTVYENKQSAIETITPMLDKDGKWRVSGYYIK